MPKPFADDFQMDALFQEQRRVRMPEVMQTDSRRARLFHKRVEAVREVIRPYRPTIWYGEDQVVIPPHRAALKPLLVLPDAVHPQGRYHGWRRAARRNGFVLDEDTGQWRKREDDDLDTNDAPDPAAHLPITGVKPFVTDTRNILLLRPLALVADREPFLKTLANAIQRGMQFVYQVEEQEIAVELIGEGEHERPLLWEAAEGGTGVWERMLADPDSFATVAREALRICHFNLETGETLAGWAERCAVACYECLLSYRNQSDHRYLDRHLVRDYLLALAVVKMVHGTVSRGYDEQYA
jgi:hypothetical protein